MTEAEKSLRNTVKQLQEKYGEEEVMIPDGSAIADVGAVSTGSISLDRAMGVGGFPRGRIVEIFGPASSGKTTLALHAIANAQSSDGTAAFIDAEHAMDLSYASAIGIKFDDSFAVSQPGSGERALEMAEQFVRSNMADVIVVDSVAALVPEAEIKGEMGDQQVGLQARLMSQAMRKLTGAIAHSDATVIFINQVRSNINAAPFAPQTTTSGGMALQFYASARLKIRRTGKVEEGDANVGNTTKVDVVKNKVAPPFGQAEFDIMFGVGIDRYRELIKLGHEDGQVIKKGAWYSYGDTRLGQGINNAADFLRENVELATQLEEEIC